MDSDEELDSDESVDNYVSVDNDEEFDSNRGFDSNKKLENEREFKLIEVESERNSCEYFINIGNSLIYEEEKNKSKFRSIDLLEYEKYLG